MRKTKPLVAAFSEVTATTGRISSFSPKATMSSASHPPAMANTTAPATSSPATEAPLFSFITRTVPELTATALPTTMTRPTPRTLLVLSSKLLLLVGTTGLTLVCETRCCRTGMVVLDLSWMMSLVIRSRRLLVMVFRASILTRTSKDGEDQEPLLTTI